MIDQTPIARKAFLTLSIIAILSFGNKLVAQNGKQIFLDNCARCHSMTARLTGPALAGIEARVTDKKKLAAWIHNSPAVLATGDAYFTKLWIEYNKSPMPPFPQFSEAEMEQLITYISTPPPVVKKDDEGTGGETEEEKDGPII